MLSRRELSLSLLMVLSCLGFSACSEKTQADPRTDAPLVRVATTEQPSLSRRSFTGVVVARVQSNLGFRVPGKIVERLVDTGDAVTQGQPLMRIDAADLSLTSRALDQAVVAANARAVQTAADEKRFRDMVSAGAVSASAYDEAKAAADSAQAQLDAAVARANVARDEASYAVLLADADGVVMEILAEPGQVVAAGQTVVRLARSGPREARIDFPETLRPEIGSVAEAALYGGNRVRSRARLRQLSDAADPLARTFEARYVLEGAAAHAPLGATVRVDLPDPTTASGMVIPLSAIYDRGDGPGVWVLGGKPLKVTWRKVRLGGITEETARVTDGLNPGEQFVALGAHLLRDGEMVSVNTVPAEAVR